MYLVIAPLLFALHLLPPTPSYHPYSMGDMRANGRNVAISGKISETPPEPAEYRWWIGNSPRPTMIDSR